LTKIHIGYFPLFEAAQKWDSEMLNMQSSLQFRLELALEERKITVADLLCFRS
jgi:hypothetical protein